MMTKTAARHRADKLEKMARDAIAQYNDETAKGGEPLFPDWALQLLGLISDYDRMAFDLAKQRLSIVKVVDFTSGRRSNSIVQRQDKILAALRREESPAMISELTALLEHRQ